jgi:ATP-dependent Clp protease ATP-binding subunit ClpB
MQLDSVPVEIDQADRRLIQLEIERQALAKETDHASRERLRVIEDELGRLRGETSRLRERWALEKGSITKAGEIKQRIEGLRVEEEKATREGNLERAAEIKYGELTALERDLEAAEKELAESHNARMLKDQVEEEDIARIVAKWTGIPVTRMLEGEKSKLVNMEDRLRQRVVGQEEALGKVSNALRRSRAGLGDPKRPIGSFIFLGPTGVGKTELARALAEFLFDDDRAMIRVDMSEYMEKHSVARMIGAPPGYVGYDEGGQLTEHVRRRPYSVVLFDEIEKAHPEVFNSLLQILEDGRLTDGKGRTVSFKNVVIIMTSNVGSQHLNDLNIGFQRNAPRDRQKEAEGRIREALRDSFRPEFLNRIDDIVIFRLLGQEQIEQIVEIQLTGLRKMLAEKGIDLKLTPAARALIVREGWDPQFGARPLRRAIQRLIQDPLAMKLLDGTVSPGDHVTAHEAKDEITFAVGVPVAA